ACRAGADHGPARPGRRRCPVATGGAGPAPSRAPPPPSTGSTSPPRPAPPPPLIRTDLHISDAQGGLLQSIFIVTYALACPVAGALGDRVNRMHLAAIGIFVWSLATVGSGLATTYALLVLARALTGVGEAGYGVVTPPLLSDCYPAAQRARVMGIFYAAIPVGSALGYIVGGVIGE